MQNIGKPGVATCTAYYLANVNVQPPRIYAGPYRNHMDAYLDLMLLRDILIDLDREDPKMQTYEITFKGDKLPNGSMNQHIIEEDPNSALAS